jgi:hypothetical protein
MNNYKLMFSGFALSAIAVGCVSSQLNQVSHAETLRTQLAFSWESIWESIASRKPPVETGKGAPRPMVNDVCIIAPDFDETILGDRPFLVWQGNLRKIGLYPDSPKNFWTTNVEGQTYATYTGQALESAQTYRWLVTTEESWQRNIRFKVMEPKERSRITNDLTKLEQSEKAKGSNSEAIALLKAKYFLNQVPQLRSDALQQVFSVEKPSSELIKIRAEIIKDKESCKHD